MLRDVREYIDRLQIGGHAVVEEYDDDPVLIDPQGRAVDTWRENYPYDHRLPREAYDEQKYALQVELLKLQSHAVETGQRHVILFEGRDAAGKGGTIKRFLEHLNPRHARVVALGKPSDREQTQVTDVDERNAQIITASCANADAFVTESPQLDQS